MSEHNPNRETLNVSQEITMTGGSIEKQVNVAHAETVNVVVVQRDHEEEEYRRPEIDFPNLDHFRGRTDKVNELTEKLTKPTKVRVLLTGMGGVGKTFLAYYVIKSLEGHYPEGQIYLDLRGYAPKKQPPLTVEEALSSLIRQFYPNDATGQVKEELRTRWREITKNKRMLLFLDNADDEKLLEALSLDYETCTMVITSRRVLSVRFLRISLESMLPEEAVAFLLEFANFQQPDRLTETRAKRLAELCGYLPLALDIVAKTIDTEEALDIEQYLTALATEKQRLRRLSNDDASVSVEASLNLSIEKLQPDLVTLWQILGIFSGSFDEDSISYIWQIDQVLVNENLSKLVKRNLVQLIPHKLEQKCDRYSLHNLLRDIALQRLDETPQDKWTCKRRLATCYRNLLADADRLYREVDNLQGLKLFDEEQANILVAHAWVEKHFIVDQSIAQDAIYYPLCGADCLRLRLPSQRRIEWLKIGIVAAEHLESDARINSAEIQEFRTNYAKLFIHLGIAYDESQRAEEAVKCYQKALKLACEVSNSELEVFCLNNLAVTYQALGQLNEAIWHYQKALQQTREIGGRKEEDKYFYLVNLATVYEDIREINRAFQFAEEALTIAKNINDFEEIAGNLCNIGNLYVAINKYDDALKNYEESLDFFDQINHPFNIGIVLDSVARLWVDKEDYLEAIKIAKEGVKIGEELNNYRILSECNSALALAYLFFGDLRTARTTVEIALTYKPSKSNHQIFSLKGIIAFGQKEYVVAKNSFEEALRQSNELLERNSQNYQAQETRELSLGGLGLCENDKSICLKALEKLSQPSSTPGLVKRMQRLFHKLIELSE